MAITVAFWLCGIGLHSLAQPYNTESERVQSQIERINAQQQQASLQLENRLTKLETKMDGIERLLWGLTGAMITLSVGSIWSLVDRRRKAAGGS
jgi:hypothetical protein